MSTFVDVDVACPGCGDTQSRTVAQSLRGSRVQALKAEILRGTFQRYRCAECDTVVALDPPLVYIDLDEGVWFSMYPEIWASRWRGLEAETVDVFRRNTIENAPPMVRNLTSEILLRTVFGLDALREKLLCVEHGLSDVALEVVKLQLLRDVKGAVMVPDRPPRLLAVEEDSLVLRMDTTDGLNRRRLARGRLDAVTQDPLSWAEAWSAVDGRAYVDIGRVFQPGESAG